MLGMIAAGLAEGAGKAVSDVADASIANRMKLDYESQLTAILQQRELAKNEIAKDLKGFEADQQIRIEQGKVQAKADQEQASADKVEGIRQGLINQQSNAKLQSIYGNDMPDQDGISDEERQLTAPTNEEMANIDLRAARQAGLSGASEVQQIGNIETAKLHKQVADDNEQFRRDKLAEDTRYHTGLIASRGGASGLGQEKWDAKQLNEHVKDNAAFYEFDDPLAGKPKVHLQGKQVYSTMVKQLGPEQADAAMTQIVTQAQNVSKDPATGQVDQDKFSKSYSAMVSAMQSRLQGGGSPQPNGGSAQGSSPQQGGSKGSPQPVKPAAKADDSGGARTSGKIRAEMQQIESQIAELKGGLLMPTPDSNKPRIKALEAELERLRQEMYKAPTGV